MEEIDRISDLPEPILHHILSYLPYGDAAQTSVLSKAWEKTWNRYPVVKFRGYMLPWMMCLTTEEKLKEERKKRKEMLTNLEKGVRNRYCKEMITIEKFSIDSHFLNNLEFKTFVERCLFFAIASGVKELTLQFPDRDDSQFNMPQFVLCSGSMELLSLSECKLGLLPPGGVQLSSLKKLHFSSVSADNQMMASLVSGCPMIENLKFDNCRGFSRLELSGLSKLKEVKLSENYELEQLWMKDSNIQLLEVCWACEECEVNVAGCENLRRLILTGFSGTNNWFYYFVSKFPLLEYLKLIDCSELEHLKISSPQLKELLIKGSWDLQDLQINAPNLSDFIYIGDIVPIQLNIPVLSKVDIQFRKAGAELQWIEKYVAFLGKFHPSPQFLSLKSTPGENICVPEKFRTEFPSPLANINHLNASSTGRCKITTLVDSLLWMSPHVKNVSINHRCGDIIYSKIEFSYDKPLTYQGDFASCCKSEPISCWKHCINVVKLDVTDANRCKTTYNLKGANIMGQIDKIFGVSNYSFLHLID